jgi:UDP-N-acetylglucosamine--N-acetylmuramyl-(pentapeptide) pyrophosphoryl-undecaprenol N-acetylglucosamine transferase|tara:strand:- start:178 stop:1293 length:1116 start_codon:yes stop_codon:yes gene_type:complete
MSDIAQPHVVIACGGTGGHFFPGVAVARELINAKARTTLLISEKQVDRQTVATVPEIAHLKIPAVGMSLKRPLRFLLGLRSAIRRVRRHFSDCPPDAVLAMGGFTAVAPIRVGFQIGIPTFLHESNAVPGRANRLLSRWVDEIFIGFEEARERFGQNQITQSGTPVRSEFRDQNREECCKQMGFDPAKPLILVTGGSQGAQGVNRMVVSALPRLAEHLPNVQWLHLCGAHDLIDVKKAYNKTILRASVYDFFHDMPLALGAADLAISRSGASSLAELAAAKAPAILVPLPTSAGDHQRVNARTAVENGGASMLEETKSTGDALAEQIIGLISDTGKLMKMSNAMKSMDRPNAAQFIATRILNACGKGVMDS